MRFGGTVGHVFIGIIVFSGFLFPRTIDPSHSSPAHALHQALNDFIEARSAAPVQRSVELRKGFLPASLAPQMHSISAPMAVPEDLLQQIECLALNIYWEAKSEPLLGQLAVAAVTLNRVNHPGFPPTICGVVQQGAESRRYQCHFSWWCDGKDDTPRERDAWRHALALAAAAVFTGVPDPTRGALWYHASYVRPNWADEKQEVARIGAHIFYASPQRKRRSATPEL